MPAPPSLSIRIGDIVRNASRTWEIVMNAPASYEIHVKGHLSEGVRSSFTGFRSVLHPAETILYGSVTDQSALHGVLARLRSLGLELVEVRRLPGDVPSSGTSRQT